MWKPVRHDRFHGRHATGRLCQWRDCDEVGEFRAPGVQLSGFDGPGDYRWFCLDHVRQFNAGYDFFDGMSSEDILRAQTPLAGWDTHTRAFRPTAGVDAPPRWADFADPLDAISARATAKVRAAQLARRPDGRVLTPQEKRAFEVLGLALDADRKALRACYSEKVRLYHPDRNGGDRSFENQLQEVIAAWHLLRRAAIFA